jgi:hypothetical protein
VERKSSHPPLKFQGWALIVRKVTSRELGRRKPKSFEEKLA